MDVTVVIGLGVMGGAAAWQLAGRGRRVIGLEQFEADHELGSSHGAARIFRLAYEQDDYVALAREALPLWRELEEATGVEILVQNGAVDYGTTSVLDRIGAAMRRHDVRFEQLTAAEARSRWDGIAFDGPVLFSPEGGRTDAAVARRALHKAATNRGADLRFGVTVTGLEPRAGGGVVVTTDAGDIEAATVIITVNAWAAGLGAAGVILPPLQVTQEQPAFFRAVDDATVWPSFIRYAGEGTTAADFACYGLPSPTEAGIKVGEHGTGIPVDPAAPRPPVDPARLERLAAYVRHHLPGLDPDPVAATRCLYATTPSEDFVLDRANDVVVGVGFSGHGFKFAPAIGRVLADLADGASRPPPRFRMPLA